MNKTSRMTAANAIMAQSMPVRRPTREDWDKYRSLIERLYEKMTLAEVIDLMVIEHGIKAT